MWHVGRLLTIPHISFQAASVPPSPAFIDDRGFAARATIDLIQSKYPRCLHALLRNKHHPTAPGGAGRT